MSLSFNSLHCFSNFGLQNTLWETATQFPCMVWSSSHTISLLPPCSCVTKNSASSLCHLLMILMILWETAAPDEAEWKKNDSCNCCCHFPLQYKYEKLRCWFFQQMTEVLVQHTGWHVIVGIWTGLHSSANLHILAGKKTDSWMLRLEATCEILWLFPVQHGGL